MKGDPEMCAEDEYQEIVEVLEDPSPIRRARMLRLIAQEPTGDPRIIPHLERYLDDRTVTLLSLPYLYGEIRWYAAAALALELQALGTPRPIVLENIPEKLRPDDIGLLASQHGFGVHHEIWGTSSDPCEQDAAGYTALRDAGLIRLIKKVVFDPYPDTLIVD